MLLETYTTLEGESLRKRLPKFVNIEKEVTGDPNYSMYNLSLLEDWKTTKKFCSDLSVLQDPEDLPVHPVKQNGHYNGVTKCMMVNGHTDHLPETNGIKSNGTLPSISNKV